MDTPIQCLEKQIKVLNSVMIETMNNFSEIVASCNHTADSLKTLICEIIELIEDYKKSISILNENQRPKG